MTVTPTSIESFILTHLQPKVRVDGGYIALESVSEDEVRLLAQGDCAHCPAGTDCLSWWIESELKREFGRPLRVAIRRDPPYYAR